MQIHYNFISFFDSLALLQGVLLGILLIIGNRKNRPSLFLGLFLITYTLELVDAILIDTGILNQYPDVLFLPFNFYFLSVPLFYFYVRSLISPVSIKKTWAVFIPGVLELTGFIVLFLLPVSTKLALYKNEFFDFLMNAYQYISLFYSIFFAILIIKIVNQHQKRVLNYFSNTEKKHLKWVKMVAAFIITFYSYIFIPSLFSGYFSGPYFYYSVSIVNVLFIYWVGISGLKQAKVEMLTELPENGKTTDSSDTEHDKIYDLLCSLMETEKRYKEPELTLPNLAKELNIPRNQLSHVINQKSGSHFNLFINQYRVEEAQRLLRNPGFNHFNMLGIAFEVGFNSKATFFAVFKRLTGFSPGVFKKKQAQQ